MFGLEAQLSIVSYAVITEKYESNKNIAISFLPLIEHILLECADKTIEKKKIEPLFKETYGYDMPVATLSYLLDVLKKQDKIDYLVSETIEIKKENLTDYDSKYDYERQLRALTTDCDFYLKKRGIELDRKAIIKLILNFVVSNSLEFNSFINYNSDLESAETENKTLDSEIVGFLIEERSKDSHNYRFIKSVFHGVLLASIISSSSNDKDSISESGTFKEVVLDSNFIFRLLDLQTEFEGIASRETFELLKKENCEFCVLPITIKQIADTINSAIKKYSNSANEVLRIYGDERFSGLQSACIRRKLTTSKLNEIIASLEDDLTQKYKIRIVKEEFAYESDADTISSLGKAKPDSSPEGLEHDLKLIAYVRSKRIKEVYQRQQAKYWVLTDDIKLTKWNTNYPQTGRIPECMTESQVATVLWLQNPCDVSLDGLFNTALVLRNRDLLSSNEFQKISDCIERQILRYSENPRNLDKLSFVFSDRLISIDDMVSDDVQAVDDKFSKALSQSSEVVHERDELHAQNAKLSEEKEKARSEYEVALERANAETQSREALLSQETQKHIETLQKFRCSKEQELTACNDEKEKTIKKAMRTGKCIGFILSSILIVGIFYIIGMVLICNIQAVESFYLKNQFVFWIGGLLLSPFFSWLISLCKKAKAALTSLGQIIYVCIFKSYKVQLKDIEKKIKEIQMSIDDIQVEIESKLVLPK